VRPDVVERAKAALAKGEVKLTLTGWLTTD
jgi:hypothetical protein